MRRIDMSVISDAGLKFLKSEEFLKEKMIFEWGLHQEIFVNHFTQEKSDLSDLIEFRGEIGFLIMVSKWMDRRDISWFVSNICDRVGRLDGVGLRSELKSLSVLLSDEEVDSNCGKCSDRWYYNFHFNHELQKHNK